MTIFEQKKNLRTKMRSLLKELYSSEQPRQQESQKAVEKILSQKAFLESEIVFMYIPKAPETDDSGIFNAACKLNKKVCVPKVICASEENSSFVMEFFYLDTKLPLNSQLEIGAYGILEPKSSFVQVKTDHSLLEKKVFMVVPGIAFTAEGVRLGQGKGFYDRYIPRLKASGCSLTTAGFCYSRQLVPELPHEATDFVLDMVIWG